ncbi:MAG TPA: MFS transporter, partial [Noviherbaspirillum sp.]|nr:MFS transporter [Noviherbaspirillum sp.]
MLPSAPLSLVILVSLLGHLALAGTRVTTSLYALSLHASAFTIGTLIAVFALFPMLLAVPAGRLVDRVGVVRPLAAGAAAVLIGCLLAAAAGDLTLLYPAAALIGTGFMAIQIAAQHMVGTMSTSEKRAANF